MQKVAVLTVNFQPDRYSYKAFTLLREHGHEVFPVAPVIETLDGIKVYRAVGEIPFDLDTVTLYLNPFSLQKIIGEIIAKKPGRVIFNPGTESVDLETQLKDNGIRFIQACTLVLLKTGRFETV